MRRSKLTGVRRAGGLDEQELGFPDGDGLMLVAANKEIEHEQAGGGDGPVARWGGVIARAT